MTPRSIFEGTCNVEGGVLMVVYWQSDNVLSKPSDERRIQVHDDCVKRIDYNIHSADGHSVLFYKVRVALPNGVVDRAYIIY